jgi:hypothetical protein
LQYPVTKKSTVHNSTLQPKIWLWGNGILEIGTTMDLLPTLAGLVNGEIPSGQVFDGKDICALMQGDETTRSPHEAFSTTEEKTPHCMPCAAETGSCK